MLGGYPVKMSVVGILANPVNLWGDEMAVNEEGREKISFCAALIPTV